MFRFNAIVESVTEAHLHLEVVTSGVDSENKRVLKLNPTGIFPTRYLLVPCGSLIQILIPTGIDIQYSWGEKRIWITGMDDTGSGIYLLAFIPNIAVSQTLGPQVLIYSSNNNSRVKHSDIQTKDYSNPISANLNSTTNQALWFI